MKTLKDHLILFDAECPICTAYAKTLTGSGILDSDGSIAYQQAPDAVCTIVDRQRAANEIALVNMQTGEVSYGIKGLLKIAGNILPLLNPLFQFRPFIWLMDKAYKFFSLNRRVILPVAVADKHTVQPAFNLHYRIAWLLCTWLITGFLLTLYIKTLPLTVPPGHRWREYGICGGQLLFQSVIMIIVDKRKLWDYLGNMMTVSFMGALLLMPMLLINNLIATSKFVNTPYFLTVVGIMLFEHMRRCRLLQIGWLPTFTWVVYRVLILGLIVATGI